MVHATLLKRAFTAAMTSIAAVAVHASESGPETVQIQDAETQPHTIGQPGSGMQPVFRGRYHKVTETGDTVLVVIFNEITVFPELKFKNKKEQEFFRTRCKKSASICQTHMRDPAGNIRIH